MGRVASKWSRPSGHERSFPRSTGDQRPVARVSFSHQSPGGTMCSTTRTAISTWNTEKAMSRATPYTRSRKVRSRCGMLMACSDAAYSALLQYCFGVDLIKTIKAWDRPMDDQLFWMLHDARALQRKPRDRTWLRLIDVPNALSSRTYAQWKDEIVFEVRDQFCPWNEGATTTWSAARPAPPADQPTSRPTSPYPSTIWPSPTSEASRSRP